MQSQTRRLRVFLCHSSGDKPAIRELYSRLRADGFNPWLDEENLEAGQEWEKEIPKAVSNSDVVIVCLSNGSINKRGFVQKEIKFALDVADEQPEGSIFIIPLRLEDCDVPERLCRWHWVNLYEERGYARLLRALRLCANRIGITETSLVGGEGIFSGVEQLLTVLFADIRGYITLFESTPPAQIVEMLNKFHPAMLKVITDHGGVLNQYLGGGLMALFGVPSATPQDASNAVNAAVSMQRQMWRVNGELQSMGLHEIAIGIGLHTGATIVGINGSDIGSAYTVVGGTVNLAARLESNAGPWQILASEETVKAAGGSDGPLRPLPPLTVKNRVQPVPLFEVEWKYDAQIGRDNLGS